MSKEPEEPEETEDGEEFDFGLYESELGLTPFDEDVLQMNEMFEAFLRGGFRERQALFLVAIIMDEAQEAEIHFTAKSDEDDEDEEEQPNGVK
jgi:hypothetical protein